MVKCPAANAEDMGLFPSRKLNFHMPWGSAKSQNKQNKQTKKHREIQKTGYLVRDTEHVKAQ